MFKSQPAQSTFSAQVSHTVDTPQGCFLPLKPYFNRNRLIYSSGISFYLLFQIHTLQLLSLLQFPNQPPPIVLTLTRLPSEFWMDFSKQRIFVMKNPSSKLSICNLCLNSESTSNSHNHSLSQGHLNAIHPENRFGYHHKTIEYSIIFFTFMVHTKQILKFPLFSALHIYYTIGNIITANNSVYIIF